MRRGSGPCTDFAVHAHLAAGRGEKSRHGIQQRGFAAARRTQQADEFTIRYFQVDVVQHGHRVAVALEDHADAVRAQFGLPGGPRVVAYASAACVDMCC